jgi:hypothetical protein
MYNLKVDILVAILQVSPHITRAGCCTLLEFWANLLESWHPAGKNQTPCLKFSVKLGFFFEFRRY